jgi:hypothetical protein
MGEFIEPISIEPLNEKPKVFTDEFISYVVEKSIKDNEIPADHGLIFVGAVDEGGLKAIIGVRRDFHGILSINFIAEHDWDGDNRVGAKVIWSHK